MNQPRRLHFSHIYSVFLPARFSQTATESDKDQEGEDLHEARERGDDEGVLKAHIGDPRRDAAKVF